MRNRSKEGLSRFLRREPTQARSHALVDAVLVSFDQLLRTLVDERQVTIERVLSRAGVSLTSFYEYFTDKDSLVGALVERATHENFRTLLADYDAYAPTTIQDAVQFFAERVATTYLAHPARSRIWLAGVGRLQMLTYITAERDRFAGELATRAKLLLPPRDDAALVRAINSICDAIIGIIVGELYRAQPTPHDQVVSAMVSLAMALLGA